ncbi:MAG: hypothetical protein KGN84_21125 [Acidobacteriota bacterium]|nr:hypothetical protein [Acidobacteriota bacterium]
MIAAILRAQLLSMRPRAGRRGGIAFAWIASLIFYGFWSFFGWGAMLFFSEPDQVAYFLPVMSSGLALVMLYWQFVPVISASFGASIEMRKLLAYPVPHGKLFLIEVLLRTMTCAEMGIILIGGAAGLLRNPAYGLPALPGIALGLLFFAATNILLTAGARYWMERFFARSKLREVLMLILVTGALLPQLLFYFHVKKAALLYLAPSQSFWPWAAAARLMLHTSIGFAALICLVWLALAWLFSRSQFERSLSFDADSVRKQDRSKESEGVIDRLLSLPSRFLPDPLGALTEKELRTFSRIPRCRLVFAMACFFGIILTLPNAKLKHPNGFIAQNAPPIMALYGFLMLGQITYWNAFGFDRSAFQGYFSWPIRLRDVLISKNLTVVILLLPQILMVSLIAWAFRMPVTPGKILETIVITAVSALYWLAMGNIFSVRIPRALDPDKMNQMSNKMQALTIWTAPLVLFPLVLAYWARWFFESQLLFAGIVLVAAIVGGIFYWVGLDSAVNTATERREIILTELSRSDSPLSMT